MAAFAGPVVSVADFVAARLSEEEPQGSVRAGRGGPWTLLDDYAHAVHLTERWVALELQVRALAGRYADHPDFDPRWRTAALPSRETRLPRQLPSDVRPGLRGR